MTSPTERCSARSIRLEESIAGTASVVSRWLLLEQLGPWPATALHSLRLSTGLGAELARRANRARVRIVLLRRHGRPTQPAEPADGPACFVAHVRPAGSWLARVPLTTPGDLLDVDLGALTAGPSDAAETLDQPLLCVCTHGRHDACCAERGRPVAAAIAARFPTQTWEVSHIGGDRFAGNLVCFPDGDYFGRLSMASAADVAQRYLDGRYALPYLRGRSCYRPAVQAADVLVRQRLGVDARGDVRALSWRAHGNQAFVRLAVGRETLTAQLRSRPVDPRRQLTCAVAEMTAPRAYELIDLAPAAAPE